MRAQRDRVAEVRRALDVHDRAVGRRQHFDEQFAADEAAVDRRSSDHEEAGAALAGARAGYAAAVLAWASGCEQLGADRLTSALPRPPDDPSAVAAAVAKVQAQAGAEEAVARQALDDDRRAELELRESTLDERAPLWRLVDVVEGATESDVNGLEAALTASGLIDAWVAPDGRVDLGPGRADVSLSVAPVSGSTLASLLAPAPPSGPSQGEAPVPASVVAAVLTSVRVAATALGPADSGAEVIMATDGTFRAGAALGRGDRQAARLLGAVARERHRVARLAELDLALAGIDDRLAGIDRREAELNRRRAAVDAELQVQPSGDDVRRAEREESDAAARLGEARDRLESTRAARREAEDAVRDAVRALTALAARHRLPTDRDGLAEMETRLDHLRSAAGTWARRRRDCLQAHREVEREARRAAEEQAALARSRTEQADTERQAGEAEARVRALDATVGVEYAELMRRMGALEAEQRANSARLRDMANESDQLLRRLGHLEERVREAETARSEAEAHRDRTHRSLTAGLALLGPDAGLSDPGPMDTSTAVLAVARSIAVAHPSVDAESQTIHRLSERVAERLHAAQTGLGARVDFDRELTDDGWWVLRTTANGVPRKIQELTAALGNQLAEGRAELAEEEERLFEQTLAGSVRRALAGRIRQANELTDQINLQLSAVRTAAAGLQVRLRWDVDPDQPDAVKAARALLLRDPADLSDAERASLQEFVRARIDQARADLEVNAPWEARLRETLDYRTWHRFQLQLAHRDWDGYVAATPRRLQKLSTGERSIALHLPMIASVAAHYTAEKGEPSCCPRLILLDELFAGVDVANRAQLFGTFSTWNLDAVFTSDHEWCQYETLDGIAIHYLHPPNGDDPVTSTRFTWDGQRRRIDSPAA